MQQLCYVLSLNHCGQNYTGKLTRVACLWFCTDLGSTSLFFLFFKVNKLSALTYRKAMTTDKRADALFPYVDCSLGKHIALNKVPNTKCLHLLNQIKVNPEQNMLEVLVELLMKSLHRIENLTSLLSTH